MSKTATLFNRIESLFSFDIESMKAKKAVTE